MKDMLLLVGIPVIWYVLNRFVLPRLGVPT